MIHNSSNFPRLSKYSGETRLVPEEDYAAAAARVQSSLASRGRGAGAGPRFLEWLPVSLRQVRDVYGRCFHLATRELATLDTQFQGETTLSTVQDMVE